MKTINKIIFAFILIFYAESIFASGFIIVSPPGENGIISNRFNPYTLEMRYLKTDVSINNLFAKTNIEQVFYNPSSVNLQGWFMFPVPKGAIIKDFTMEINGVQVHAELLDAPAAKKIYEDIIRKMQDPALLEYYGTELFKVRIFPIEANKEKKITISYTQVLDFDNNTLEYIFPLNSEKYSSKPIKNFSIDINLKSDKNITTVYSPSHEVIVNKTDKHSANIKYKAENLKVNSNFILFTAYSDENIGLSLSSYNEQDTAQGFFFMNISPAFVNKNDAVEQKNVIFILDVSGSMLGEKMDKAKAALKYCVSNLNKNDKFEIVKFSTFADVLFGEQKIADQANVKTALEYINSMKAVGGTNVQDGFEKAFSVAGSNKGYNSIIFITDGKPTIGETDNDKLIKIINSQNVENFRIFSLGIGNEINTHLLDKITTATNAYGTYIAENEDIEIKISNFFEKISYPVMTDIKISINGNPAVSDYYPSKIPDLFIGSSINLFGKFSKFGKATISVSGMINSIPKTFKYNVNFNKNTENYFIAELWATRKIGFLLDQIRLNGENKELSDEIIILAKK